MTETDEAATAGALRWAEQTRSDLSDVLPEALVVLAIGATEQHGPHLATGTDALLAQTVVERAAEQAAAECPRRLVIAPTLPYGASDHHLPFGGTLSLAPETLHAVLLDVARSIAACGGRRLVIVNGHGGNHGVAHAAAAAASNRYDVTVATTDYWRLLPAADESADAASTVPGHAGEFETSLVRAVRPELIAPTAPREAVRHREAVEHREGVAGFDLHGAKFWSSIDGFTDDPGRADADGGNARLTEIVQVLATRLIELAKIL